MKVAAGAVLLIAALAAACGAAARQQGDLVVLTPTALSADATTAPPEATPLPGSTGTARAPRPTRVAPQMRSSGCGVPASPGDSIGEVDTPDGPRSYRLHVPKGYDPRRAAALVLSFHGYAQTAEQQDAYSELPALSDAKGFVLVTPEGGGSPQGWSIVGNWDEWTGMDDVAFVSTLVQKLSSTLCLDSRRVYATGHSNGAEMASQLACFLPGLIAAAAPVSGAIFQDCEGSGVPIIAFQGTEDWNVPYEDSAGGVERWVAHNGCPAEPDVSAPANGVELRSWKCPGGDVQFYVLDGVGHVWPGGNTSRGGVGEPSDALNASELMWEFFRTHPKR